MHTLYKDLSEEQQKEELKEFEEKHHEDVINGVLCVLCGMQIHSCLCSHED